MNTLTHAIDRSAGSPRRLRERLADAVRGVVATWQLWRERSRSRAELRQLSDEILDDIGVSRGQANFEGSKPFWRG